MAMRNGFWHPTTPRGASRRRVRRRGWWVAALALACAALAPSAASAAPFSCTTPSIFIAQGSPTQLFEQVYGAGSTRFVAVGPSSGVVYNAIAFNPADRFIYAIAGGALQRIGDTGALTNLGAVSAPSNANVGAISGGTYYVMQSSTNTLHRINLTTLADSAVTLSEIPDASDLTFVGGYLWGVRNGTSSFVRVDVATGQVTVFPSRAVPTGLYGAVWTYGNGNLGISENVSGNVYQVRVANPGSASPTFTLVSQATGPASSNNDGTACVSPPADLSVVKSGPAVVEPGAQVTWTMTVTNNGAGGSSGFTLTDAVPAGIANASTSTAGCSVSGGALQCVLGPLAVGASTTITMTGTAPSTTSTCVTNAAEVLGNEADGNAANDRSSVQTCTRDPLADVSVVKSADAAAVLLGNDVTYTLTVANAGPDPAQDVHVEDVAGAGVSAASVTPSQGTCATATSCDLGTLAPGQSATITVTASATALGAQGNTATATSSTGDPDPSNNASSTTVQVEPQADLRLVKRASDATVNEGESLRYTVTVVNDGPSTARDAVVTDAVPAGLRVDAVSSSRGSCTQGDPVVCQLGDLAVGASATITIEATATDAGTPTNTAIVTSPTPDPDPSDNQDSTVVRTDRRADLGIAKTASSGAVIVGESFAYTLTVSNDGPSRATGVVVTDRIPDGLRLETASSSQGTCAGDPAIVCEIGTLARGERATVRITVTAIRAGETTNGASVTSEVPDPDPGDNVADVPVEVGTKADLRIAKTASASTVPAGGTVVYGLVVSNDGPNEATDVTVTDPVPAGARVVSATPSAGRCEVAAAVVCRLGTLADGASATVRLEVVFDEAGTTRNVARVTSPTPDPDPSDDRSETEVTSEKADLRIEKRASARAVALGGSVTYRLVVTNDGPSTARGVVVTDPVPAGLRIGTVTTTAGSCAVANGTLVCSLGDLDAGASARVTVAARAVRQGRVGNVASVVAQFPSDPDPSDDRDGATLRVRPGTARIAVEKRASSRAADPGDRVRYRIVVRNVGDRTAHDVRVCDRLPAGLAYVDRGGARLRGGSACWTIAALAPHARKRFAIVARVLSGEAARLTNVADAKGSNTKSVRATATLTRRAGALQVGGVTG